MCAGHLVGLINHATWRSAAMAITKNLKGVSRLMATAYKWQFAPRFRRNAFGWKSSTPILRIKEALTEIKTVAKKEPVLAAGGAVLFWRSWRRRLSRSIALQAA